jgi:DNA-binding beta-propeller fold protein YncE
MGLARHMTYQRPLIAILLFIFIAIGVVDAVDVALDGPISIAVSSDGANAFIANQNQPSILVLDTNSLETRQIEGNWNGMVDLVVSRRQNRLLAIATNPPLLLEISSSGNDSTVFKANSLPGVPAKLSISDSGQTICITMTWKHALCVIPLSDGQLPEPFRCEVVPLDFQPKEVLALADGRFLIADAFGGRLAVVDATGAKVIASHTLPGHHIGGLARDESKRSVAISHQRLSSIAQSTQVDIHWGALIQNLVSVVEEADLMNPAAKGSTLFQPISLGEVGKGAADPSGIAVWDGSMAIAISGTNQIAYRHGPKGRFQYVDVGQSPARIVRVHGSKFMWLSKQGNLSGLLEGFADHVDVLCQKGNAPTIENAEQRGEAAFFSGRLSHDNWMSCNSCHVDGHSPDLLADTLSDRRFGNPKRIPSLLNAAETGPWTWNGGAKTLEEQIAKTLSSTMHRDLASYAAFGTDESVAQDIAAYLRKLRIPFEVTADLKEQQLGQQQLGQQQLGQEIFQKRGCDQCHRPELHYTTPKSYDVGVYDETGESQFNPPSLEGARYRKSFFHDGRYKSMKDLLGSHPDPSAVWTEEELDQIILFLKRL